MGVSDVDEVKGNGAQVVQPEEVKTEKKDKKEKEKEKRKYQPLNTETTKYNVKLTFTTPILGSAPSNPDIYAKFVATKKAEATAEQITSETETIPPIPFDERTGKMIFRVDPESKAKIFLMHQIKGFLKAACSSVLGKEITSYKSKIDRLIFVTPLRIPLKKNGEIITALELPLNERPLSAQTMQGPRVTLVSSEELAECTVDFQLEVLPLGEKDFDQETLDYIFQYGQYSGISQWRSAGYGRFTFELERI